MRRGLAFAVAVVGLCFFVAALGIATVPKPLLAFPVPAATIAKYYSGRHLEVAVTLGLAVGTLALIVAEYLALGRLIHWLHGVPLQRVLSGSPSRSSPPTCSRSSTRSVLRQAPQSLARSAVHLAADRLPRLPALSARSPLAAARRGRSGLVAWGFYTVVAGSAST